nr:N-acetylneuraminate synthase [Lewinella cohaerens]
MMDSTLIIAEAGVNHNGSMEMAKKLVDAAAEAKVDLVKFQTFKADKLVTKTAKKATYQQQNLASDDDSQYNMLKSLELSENDHLELIAYAQSKGVKFFSTAFDVEGLDYLNDLGFEQFKIPSGEITNYPYLLKLAQFGKPVILSTGMANMTEIKDALKILTSESLRLEDITVLHCNTEYPTPFEDVNLTAMLSIAKECNVKVGYSDHTLGIEVPMAAVALGATVIEKHFTLDRNLPGPDHKASLEPNELKAMVKAIRNIEKAIAGDGIKKASPSELKNKAIARKSIHLANPVNVGQQIREADLIALRPGDGISPMEWREIIGKKATRDMDQYHQLSREDLA